jgi:hypothetical protein
LVLPVLPVWLVAAVIGLGGFLAGVVFALVTRTDPSSLEPVESAAPTRNNTSGFRGDESDVRPQGPQGTSGSGGPNVPGGASPAKEAPVSARPSPAPAAAPVAPSTSPAIPRPQAAAPTPGGEFAMRPLGAAAVAWVELLGEAIRRPLRQLRRLEDAPPEVVAQLERIYWQARMLTEQPRPGQGRPAAPITLLESAAERVELLRLGKVGAAWTVLTRRPVHVDADRVEGAFRELLTAACDAAGDGGRVGIRVAETGDPERPIGVEIQIGRKGGEYDALSLCVAFRILETQRARIDVSGSVVKIALPIAPESVVGRSAEGRQAHEGRPID